MSNPPNPLGNFRTYSYHHFLLVTDGMNTATELANESDVIIFNRDVSEGRDRFAPRLIGEDGGYVVLIDGMRDVQFYINSAKWETIIAPSGSAGGQRTADTIEVDGQLVITEPLGIRFLEVLTNTAKALETDPSGLIFVLKTIFVGHRDDGVQETISNVRPFLFTMTDITAVIDVTGATYTMSIVGVNNGTAKLPQISRVAQGINLQVHDGQTVGSALEEYQNCINGRYAQFKEALATQLQESGSELDLDRDFREVLYKIVSDEVYSNEDYLAGDNLPTPTGGTPGQQQITNGPNATVESGIRAIMNSSKRVDDDAANKNPEKRKYIYKIVSTLLPDNQEDKLIVEYSVHRYEVITQVVGEPLEPVEGEFIEFDYIFTGRNVDVLEFDIKMDMGLSFFYTVATSNNIAQTSREALAETSEGGVKSNVTVGAQSTVGTAKEDAVPAEEETKDIKRNPRTPLFLGTTISDPLIRNKADPITAATFDALLTRHAAFENVECSLKIAGNPQLLDESTPQPEEASGEGTETTKTGTTGLNRIYSTPSLIKVNVRFPSDTDLSGIRDFWYKGFYNLYSITQVFDEGLFTQELQLFSLPQSDGLDENLSTASERDTNAEQATTPSSEGSAEEQTVGGEAGC